MTVPAPNRIRALRPDDLAQVADLYQRVVRAGGTTPPGLTGYFARTFLDHPWADPAVPSLVHESDDGAITGFLGSHVRRMRFEDTPIRIGCSGQLVADPGARRGIGALLLRHYLAGPQELTITDGATDAVRRMWERLGGSTGHLRSLNWTRVFKPGRLAGGALAARAGRRDGTQRPGLPLLSVLDLLAGWAARGAPQRSHPTARPETHAEPLEPSALVMHLPAVAGQLLLVPDYDEAFATWLFAEMAAVRSRGELVRCLVRDTQGRVLGWYVSYLQPGGVSQVLQVAAAERDVGAVLDHLFSHARERGVAALQGRVEPLLFEALATRRCLLHHTERALIHTFDLRLGNTLLSGRAMLTRMDGEWWMGHHLEPFEVAT